MTAPFAATALLATQVFFSKSFPGSSPAYFEIEIEQSGAAVYREAPNDEQPLRFHLTPKDTAEIFALAEKLGFFSRPLESKFKVANMGMKTLRYQDGARRGEQKFNYADDPDARTLSDWFERISETEQCLLMLERVARFDRMGINKALLLVEASWDKNRLVAAEQLLPILDKVATQKGYLHMAQVRAASLADRIRAPRTQN